MPLRLGSGGPLDAWMGVAIPVTRGQNLYYSPQFSTATSATLGNGNLRLAPFYLKAPCTISQLFAEFTAAGDAASLLATCIYADNGSGFPGSLVAVGPTISTGTGNAGSVASGGTPGVYAGALISGTYVSGGIATVPAGLYWSGATIQGVTVTQPTIRIGLWGYTPLSNTSLFGAGATPSSYLQGSVTGALPATFTGSAIPTNAVSPRVGIRVP